MRGHIEYNDATDIDDLIDELHDLNDRLSRLRIDILEGTDTSVIKTTKRSHYRLYQKRDNLLRALNEALSYLR
jgi:hypothetical protein